MGRVPATSEIDRISFELFSVHIRIGDRHRSLQQIYEDHSTSVQDTSDKKEMWGIQNVDKVELNRLTNLIHMKIREFWISKFEEDVQEVYKGESLWKFHNRFKNYCAISNTSIQGRGEVMFDALSKAMAVAECLEDQLIVYAAEDRYRQHYV
jgi:hypothetical protein